MADITKNALIIAPQWIGDAVMTEPLLRRLAARGERLTVAALPWIAPVYRVMPGVAHVIELPFKHGGLQLVQRWRLARQLRGQFDVAYVCPNSLKSALLPWFAGIAQRVGYVGEHRSGLLTHSLPNPSKLQRPPMVAWYAALSECDGRSDVDQAALLPVLATDVSLMAQTLQALTLQHSLPSLTSSSYVVFAPGAEYGPAKRWPTAHFAALAAQLDRPVLLLGSAKENDICQAITRAANAVRPGSCFNLAGQTQLLQAFALIAQAHRVVSNDSGLMHVAAAFGVPQVAVFGSSSPEHTPPLNAKARVIWLHDDPDYQPALTCAPCFERICPLGHMRCLNDISPERVRRLL